MMIASLPQQPRITSEDGPPARYLPAAVLPLIAVLRQLADVIRTLTVEQYRIKPVGVVSSNANRNTNTGTRTGTVGGLGGGGGFSGGGLGGTGGGGFGGRG